MESMRHEGTRKYLGTAKAREEAVCLVGGGEQLSNDIHGQKCHNENLSPTH